MGWLDGMTGCGGECNIDGSSVSFSNFKLLDEGAGNNGCDLMIDRDTGPGAYSANN